MYKTKQTNPQAAAVVWNYDTRFTSAGAEDPNSIEQVIINSASLMYISTSKSKSNPAGTFEMGLAPTFNWVSRITTGSWCAILMSQDDQIDETFTSFANPQTFKMLGRIQSVRTVVSVNQETGARQTRYVVTGEDWGSVFNTTLYIDTIARNNNLGDLPFAGHGAAIAFSKQIVDWKDDKHVVPSSSQIVQAIINIWGSPLSDFEIQETINEALDKDAGSQNPTLRVTSEAQFKLPKPVASFMRQNTTSTSTNFAELIQKYDGVLTGKDTYSGDNKEAFGFINPASLYGTNTFWQLLTDNCNPILNELVTDVRWEGGSPKLALYKRIRPFILREKFRTDGAINTANITNNISLFKDIRHIDIDLEDVVSINAGTNWRDKTNFIEVKPQPHLNQLNYDAAVKANAQVVDTAAYERDGFKPRIEKADYMPYEGNGDGATLTLAATDWKHLMREWYFNTHNLLNGAVSFIGQNKYIQVGDNIRIDSDVLGVAPFNVNQRFLRQNGEKTYLLAHVENISHNFTVDEEGSRSFITTVQFVRGVIVDSNNRVLGGEIAGFGASGNSAVDPSASDMSGEQQDNVLGTSTESDPDPDKLEGN